MYSGCSVSFCAASELLFLNANELALEVEVGGALDLEVVENPSQAAVHAVLCLRARFHYRMQNQIKWKKHTVKNWDKHKAIKL